MMSVGGCDVNCKCCLYMYIKMFPSVTIHAITHSLWTMKPITPGSQLLYLFLPTFLEYYIYLFISVKTVFLRASYTVYLLYI